MSNRDAETETAAFELYIVDLGGTNLVRLTTDGNAINAHPSVSPDGQSIVYESNRDAAEGTDLYVLDIPSRETRRITSDEAVKGYPRWSPEGDRILYAAPDGSGNLDLYTVRPDGSDLGRLTRHYAEDGGSRLGHSWLPVPIQAEITDREDQAVEPRSLPQGSSPVTNAILFATDSTNCTACLDTGIYQVSFDGANLVRLPISGLYPTWSDDFRQITYIRNGELFLANADGSSEVQATSAFMNLGAPSWGTGGREILAACRPEQLTEMCLVDPQTGRIRRINSPELTAASAGVFYWINERDGMVGANELVFNVEGQLIDTLPLSGRVSPNRESIAHIMDRQLAISTILGEDTRILTTDATTKGFPVWSPDGQLVVFSVAPGDEFIYLFAIRADGNTPAYQLVARPIARGPEARPDALDIWQGYGWTP